MHRKTKAVAFRSENKLKLKNIYLEIFGRPPKGSVLCGVVAACRHESNSV